MFSRVCSWEVSQYPPACPSSPSPPMTWIVSCLWGNSNNSLILVDSNSPSGSTKTRQHYKNPRLFLLPQRLSSSDKYPSIWRRDTRLQRQNSLGNPNTAITRFFPISGNKRLQQFQIFVKGKWQQHVILTWDLGTKASINHSAYQRECNHRLPSLKWREIMFKSTINYKTPTAAVENLSSFAIGSSQKIDHSFDKNS